MAMLFGLVDILHVKLDWHLVHTSAKAQKSPFIQLNRITLNSKPPITA